MLMLKTQYLHLNVKSAALDVCIVFFFGTVAVRKQSWDVGGREG